MPEASPFVTLHEDDFEDLCCDVIAKEPDISTADRFGIRGQRQNGIDVRAYRRDGGSEVAQCKRYVIFTKTDLRTAADSFIASKEVWKSWDVRRFLVCVACTVSHRRVQDVYQELREEFRNHGIVFELWGAASLAQKLRGDRTVAEKYFAGEKLQRLSGSAFTGPGPQLSPLDAARTQMCFAEECGAEFEGEAEEELRGIRELARSGHARSASGKVQRLRDSPRWSLLRARTRAQLLRLAASLKLDCDRDVDGAEQHVREAREIDDRLNYQIVDAAIALHRTDAQGALAVLGEPRDIDAFNIQLALLEQVGEAQKVLAGAADPPFEPNAGTYRIASIAAVALRNVASAEQFAAEALACSPNWYLVRSHAAKIDYLHCILPEFSMWHQLQWPLPPDSQYIKTDSESLKRLNKAEAEFETFLRTVELDADEERAIQTWRLACLACNPVRRNEAAAYASRLLSNNQNHIPAAIWAMHKGLEFDKAAFFEAMQRQNRSNRAFVGDVQPIIVLLAEDGKFDEAIALLDSAKQSFDEQNVAFIWRFLRGQLAAAQGDNITCSVVVADEPDQEHRRKLQTAILRIEANRTHHFDELAQFLLDLYRDTSNPGYLFEACETLLRAGKPERGVQYCKELLCAYPTGTALRIAVQACFEANEFDLCVRLLRDHRTFFPDAELPPVLRRVEIECLRQTGELTTAASMAESLASRHTDTETLVTLFQTQLSLGDLRAGARTARQLADRPDMAPAGLLQIARLIQPEDEGLAVKLWEEAVRRGVDDPPALMMAVNLGFRFGLEDLVEPLMPRFYALSQEPGAPVSAYGLHDIRALMTKMQRERADVVKLHADGAIPLHLLATRINTPLAALLCEQGRLNVGGGQPLVGSPLLIRAGSKATGNSISRNKENVYVDVTSLLIADFLGILDVVEKSLAPLFISAHIQNFLQDEVEKALPHQPTRDSQRQKVLKLVEDGRLAVCSIVELSREYNLPIEQSAQLLARHAKSQGGIFCDFARPEVQNSKTPLEPDEEPFLLLCSDLARAMLRSSIISQAEFDFAMARMVRNDEPKEPFQFQQNQKILLGFGIAEHLLGAGLLESLLSVSVVTMLQEDVQDLRAEAEAHQLRLRTVERLTSLQDRIHAGLRDGVYKPVQPGRPPSRNARATESAAELCLWDLLGAGECGASVVWTDDRFLSRYTAVGKLPSVGVLEILQLLRKEQRISADEFFKLLLQLRESNARYLPVFAEEVSYHLNRAAIIGGSVTETAALRTLRRYVAGCFLDKERLQPPFTSKKRKFLGEFNWVLETIRSISEAIARLWESDSQDDSTIELRADWLLQISSFLTWLCLMLTSGSYLMTASKRTQSLWGCCCLLDFICRRAGRRSATPLSHRGKNSTAG